MTEIIIPTHIECLFGKLKKKKKNWRFSGNDPSDRLNKPLEYSYQAGLVTEIVVLIYLPGEYFVIIAVESNQQ